jgi:hypothetical protein
MNNIPNRQSSMKSAVIADRQRLLKGLIDRVQNLFESLQSPSPSVRLRLIHKTDGGLEGVRHGAMTRH